MFGTSLKVAFEFRWQGKLKVFLRTDLCVHKSENEEN